eukprot:TRINITY_DN9735_c0_g1_i1.p1 TRINITY_DN9735_c0_g1~~TRINITY_DN9735_c0_g1_i1.p1  ORF type:complete len:327 (+),score=43.38 TRINITY_DN9735_c0_g1_i1:62-1042(+)
MLWGSLIIARGLVYARVVVGQEVPDPRIWRQKMPPCPAGYIDVTGGAANWWSCAADCPGGAWSDSACCCACASFSELTRREQHCDAPAKSVIAAIATTTVALEMRYQYALPPAPAAGTFTSPTPIRSIPRAIGTSDVAQADGSDHVPMLLALGATSCVICLISVGVCGMALSRRDESQDEVIAKRAWECEQGQELQYPAVTKMSQVQPVPFQMQPVPDLPPSVKLTPPQERSLDPPKLHVQLQVSSPSFGGTPSTSTNVSRRSSPTSSRRSSKGAPSQRSSKEAPASWAKSSILQVPVDAASSKRRSRSTSPTRSHASEDAVGGVT